MIVGSEVFVSFSFKNRKSLKLPHISQVTRLEAEGMITWILQTVTLQSAVDLGSGLHWGKLTILYL